jgi:hypothetical protein
MVLNNMIAKEDTGKSYSSAKILSISFALSVAYFIKIIFDVKELCPQKMKSGNSG